MLPLLLTLLLSGLVRPALSQSGDNFPVTLTPIIDPAYSLNLSDYATNSQLLRLDLRLKDLTKPQLQVCTCS